MIGREEASITFRTKAIAITRYLCRFNGRRFAFKAKNNNTVTGQLKLKKSPTSHGIILLFRFVTLVKKKMFLNKKNNGNFRQFTRNKTYFVSLKMQKKQNMCSTCNSKCLLNTQMDLYAKTWRMGI